MIEKIISYTTITKESDTLLNLNGDSKFLESLNYKNNVTTRQSFRFFDINQEEKVSKSELLEAFNVLERCINSLFKIPEMIELCILDNKGILGAKQHQIYAFNNGEFEKVDQQKNIGKQNLFIQEEMHDAEGVFFFLWDFSKLPCEYKQTGRFYKEIIIFSGLLGQIASEFGAEKKWQGTVFAGLIDSDWKAVISEKRATKTPIFAYSFQKNKKKEGE